MQINKYHGSYNISTRTQTIKYIVLHYVGAGSSSAGNALANCKYFAGGDRQASAHYFVDDGGIWEYADPSSYYTWHCGDGHGAYGITNANSIGIEVCINGDSPYTETEIMYLKELVPHLMKKYSVSASHVVRHYDASRKMCPYYYAKRDSEWKKLRTLVTNGTSKAKTMSQIAQEVIDGKWGTGDERKRRLRAAGYDPDQVQKLVNSMLTKNGWKKENGVWHCYRNDVMLKNCWAKDSNGWCWLNSKGEITKFKWIQDKGTWYYLNSDGYMATNKWQRDSKGWCYVGSDGKMYKSRWLKWKGAWYWLKSDGRMATSPQTIGGKVYKFGKDGKWVK